MFTFIMSTHIENNTGLTTLVPCLTFGPGNATHTSFIDTWTASHRIGKPILRTRFTWFTWSAWSNRTSGSTPSCYCPFYVRFVPFKVQHNSGRSHDSCSQEAGPNKVRTCLAESMTWIWRVVQGGQAEGVPDHYVLSVLSMLLNWLTSIGWPNKESQITQFCYDSWQELI